MYTHHLAPENMSFFRQSMDNAIAYRLMIAQREASDHAFLERRLPNLWEAVRQSYHRKAWASVVAFREALQPVLDLHGYWQQSLLLNEWAREGAEMLGDRLRAIRYTHDRADILHQQGHYAEAARLYRVCEEAYRTRGEKALALKSCHMRALVLRAQGRSREARQVCETTIAEAQQIGLQAWMAHPLYVLGLLLRDQGAMQQSEDCVKHSLALLTAHQDPGEESMIAQCYHFLGETALRRGDLEEAKTYLSKSLLLSQQLGIIRRIAATQRVLGDWERAAGHFVEAERLYDEAFQTSTRLGDRPEVAKLQFSRAKLLMRQHDAQAAVSGLKAARVLFQQIGDTRGVVGVSLLLGQWYLRQVRLLQAASALFTAFRISVLSGLLRPSNLRRFWGWWTFRGARDRSKPV